MSVNPFQQMFNDIQNAFTGIGGSSVGQTAAQQSQGLLTLGQQISTNPPLVAGSSQDLYSADLDTLTWAIQNYMISVDWLNGFYSMLQDQYVQNQLSMDAFNSVVAQMNQTAQLAGIPGTAPQLIAGQQFSNQPQTLPTSAQPSVSSTDPLAGLNDAIMGFGANIQRSITGGSTFGQIGAEVSNTLNVLSWPWKTTLGIPNWILVGGAAAFILLRRRN